MFSLFFFCFLFISNDLLFFVFSQDFDFHVKVKVFILISFKKEVPHFTHVKHHIFSWYFTQDTKVRINVLIPRPCRTFHLIASHPFIQKFPNAFPKS